MSAPTTIITLGLSEIQVGLASSEGVMPTTLEKIGKTYRDTCKLSQDAPDVTEHYEEGHSSPEVSKKRKKMPTLKFSIMGADVNTLIDYVGGENIGTEDAPKWGYDGTEKVLPRAIRVVPEQGMVIDIPNADIEALITADVSSKGIFLVEFTVKPLAVTSGKPFQSFFLAQ